MRAILSLLCVLYVDDGSWASCDATCLRDFLAVIVSSKVIGVLLELAKARVSNSPRTLGFQWDLHTGKLSIPNEKLELIGSQGDYVLRKAEAGQAVEINVVDSLLGRVTWATQCFTRYRCHLAPIFAWLKAVKRDISRLELFAIVLGLLIVGEIQSESEGECTVLSDNTAAIHSVGVGSRVLSMDPRIAGKVAQMLESRCPQIYGGPSSRLELAETSEASRVQSVAVRPAVRSGGALRSSFTHSRQRTGSGSEPYALRPSVRIAGS
ncbi:hypothetical protein FOZ62_003029, partial [Perkinsus olseni]